jgi:acyl carrier protein
MIENIKTDTEALKKQLKQQIVEFLNLTSVQPEDIADLEPLFGEGLGLDSIDSLELIVLLSREYGVNIQDPKEGRKILVNVSTMADYIQKHRTI